MKGKQSLIYCNVQLLKDFSEIPKIQNLKKTNPNNNKRLVLIMQQLSFTQ